MDDFQHCMRAMRALASAIVLTLLCACAASPAATVPAAGLSSSPAPVEAQPGKTARPAGYKVVERHGTTLFCTRIATLGTKFKQEFCMTRDEYAELQRRGENVRQDLRKSTKICGGGGAGGGISTCNGS